MAALVAGGTLIEPANALRSASAVPVPETSPTFVATNQTASHDEDEEAPKPSPSPSPKPTQSSAPQPSGTSGGSGNVGPRPYGLKGLKRVFGRRCNPRANDARTWYPSAGGRGKMGYVYYHSKLARKVGRGVVGKMRRQSRMAAADYGVWGYACRMKVGGTSWSVHSWGAAVDTNTLRNPFGQRRWNGRGSNGRRYGRYLPNLWMKQNFYWGIHFADPMHFQYVSGY